MTVEPMTDAELDPPMTDGELDAIERHMTRMAGAGHVAMITAGDLDRIRVRIRAAEAERDAAVARAMPEPRLLRTVEEVEALPDGNYAYCFAQGKRLRGLATKRNRVWTFIGTDDECEPNSTEMAATWVSGPLPSLPTPTAAQEG